MESDQPLDLNNDGISSSNLYEEIAAPVHGNNKDETPIPFYHFEEWSNYAEVRPAFDDQPDYQLLLLRLPLQEIIFQNRKETEPYLAFYTHDLTDYEYTLTEDSSVDLRLVNPDAVRLGVVERLERTGKDTLVVEMTARYLDFFNHQWTYIRINVTYEKVERSSERCSHSSPKYRIIFFPHSFCYLPDFHYLCNHLITKILNNKNKSWNTISERLKRNGSNDG